MEGGSHHPDEPRVKELILTVLQEGKMADWMVELLDFDFYSSTFRARLGLDGQSVIAKIPTEWIKYIWAKNTRLRRRKLKRSLKEAVKPFADLA